MILFDLNFVSTICFFPRNSRLDLLSSNMKCSHKLCSTSYISCYVGWNMCTRLMFCTVILSRVIYWWIQTVTLKLVTSVWQGQHLKPISWLSMLLRDGTEPRNCSSIVLSTPLRLMFGLSVAYLVKSWPESPCFLAKTMFIN